MVNACADIARRIVRKGGNECLDQKSPLGQKASFGSWLNGNPKGKVKVEVAENQQATKPSTVLVVIGYSMSPPSLST